MKSFISEDDIEHIVKLLQHILPLPLYMGFLLKEL